MEDLDELDRLSEKFKAEGKYVDALDIVERGLNIRKVRFGEDSQEVKKSYHKLCELCNILATHYLQRDDSDLAFDLLKRAELLCETDDHARAITYNNLACYYRKTGKARVALTYLKKALALDNDTPNTHLNLCASLSQIDKHEKALEHAMQAVILLQDLFITTTQANQGFEEHAPVLAIAYHNMAVELEYLKRTNEAITMYQKAVDFAKKNLPVGHPVIDSVQRVLHNATKDVEEHKEKTIKRRQKNSSKTQFYANKKMDKKDSRREIDEERSYDSKRKTLSTDPAARPGRTGDNYEPKSTQNQEGPKSNLIE
ncbi:unnamed protein product [Blepharisma stoltei]|uniref:Kinesin light chain n=1 Tax=Blepharisma stoltei TaxID=1481888 RepID=A0AAU9IAI1_9CILI|nr:unnamed protein product [Blepharisma stoltei]